MKYLQLITSPRLSHIMAPHPPGAASRVAFGLCGIAAWVSKTQITDAPERRMCSICNREARRTGDITYRSASIGYIGNTSRKDNA